MKQTFKSTVKSLLALTTVAILGVSCQKEVAAPEEGTRDAAVNALMNQAAPPKGTQTIVELALADANFTELVKALQFVDAPPLNAGLIDALSGTDQFTVFAPKNEAFVNLYKFLADNNIQVTQELVADVLLYHVTEGRRAANSVIPRTGTRTIETLLTGTTFSVNKDGVITATGNTASVGPNMANIVRGNLSASNGIIHEIDAVIIP